MNQERNIYTKAYDGNPTEKWGDMWKFTDLNLSKIAKEMGAVGIRVEEPAQISPAIKKALTCNKPVLIEVISDQTAMAALPQM